MNGTSTFFSFCCFRLEEGAGEDNTSHFFLPNVYLLFALNSSHSDRMFHQQPPKLARHLRFLQ